MKRRELLVAGGSSLLYIGAAGLLVSSPDDPGDVGGDAAAGDAGVETAFGGGRHGHHQSETIGYRYDRNIVYGKDDISLTLTPSTVTKGETLTYKLTNETDTTLELDGNAWAIETLVTDQWKTAAWTSAKYGADGPLLLSPHDTRAREIELTQSSLAEQSQVRRALHSGQYRFVFLGTAPFLAAEFTFSL